MTDRDGLALLSRLLVVILGSYLLAQVLVAALGPHPSLVQTSLLESAVIVIGSTGGLWWGLIRGLRAEHRAQLFDQQLQTGLSMGSTESACHDVVRRAVIASGVEGHVQLMLADSSEAHLKVAVNHGGEAHNGCRVVAPFDCPAIRRSQTSLFRAEELDACPWLANRSQGEDHRLRAVCVPLNVAGRSIGVLHVAGSRPAPSALAVRSLEAIAERAGARIGLLRVLEQTHLQAATDPLTGLLNRRSLENRVYALLRSEQKFALAMADLDHFKALNDTHGHEAGDRGLRLFARTLQLVLRSDDIVARYGGEEFVLVFPGLTAIDAASALERARDALALAVDRGTLPAFTASFGVADSADADGLEELLRLADGALFQAKRQGRNRVVIDASGTGPLSAARNNPTGSLG